MDLEHRTTGHFVRERNVDTLLETSTNGRIQFPWLWMNDGWIRKTYDIGGTEDENAGLVIANTVHLNEEFIQSLASTSRLITILLNEMRRIRLHHGIRKENRFHQWKWQWACSYELVGTWPWQVYTWKHRITQYLALSPCHLLTRSEEDTDMNVQSAWEATALAM